MTGGPQKRWLKVGILLVFLGTNALQGDEIDIDVEELPQETAPLHPPGKPEHALVEFFTADTLREDESTLGTIVNVGITDELMVGFDMISMAVGAPNLNFKKFLWSDGKHAVALGLQLSYLDRKTMLWGSIPHHFDELTVRTIKPTLTYTRRISPRLRIHSAVSIPFGTIEAELSEEGKRKLFLAKYPQGDYETRQRVKGDDASISDNQAKPRNHSGTHAQRTQQVSSVSGLASDIFQVTGDILRDNGNRILVTTRIEQTEVKELKANNFRLTIAQQWIWDHFNYRIGLGLQYLVLSGEDLDGEKLDEAGILPASDIIFYWRF